MVKNKTIEPNHYPIRYSKKAKYLQLRLTPSGLQVIVPRKGWITSAMIEQFISEKQAWVKKQQEKLALLPKPEPISLPTQIYLPTLQKSWEVNYFAVARKSLTLQTNRADQIILLGDVNNTEGCLRLLRRWLKNMGDEFLSQQLQLCSFEVGLPFNNVTIRNNQSRWGSCSVENNISLCCKLLFLPFNLMRHVLIHELCHTKYKNHGKKFWGLLKRLDHFTEEHIRQLKEYQKQIPRWV